jgi:hypothetical protein
MKNFLTNATKKRIIREIRSILYNHPRYKDDSNNVQNKYSFEERPRRGVIVDGTSADRVRLSADNYIGRLSSFVMQAQVENHLGNTLEWVIENKAYLEQFSPRRDIFPSPPGVYLLEVRSIPDEARNIPGYFTLQPYLNETDEPLITFSTSADLEGQLSRSNIVPNSVRLWLDGKRPLLRGVDFTVDSDGLVTFLKTTPTGLTVFADYRYTVDQQGPFPYYYEQADLTALPGAILAFGERAQECDKLAIVVNDSRTDVAEVYGGKFEVNFDLTVFSKDSEDREKLSDYIVVSILERQLDLGFDGIELLDISPGGESEEIYNVETDEYYYNGSVSVAFRVDWEIYIPLPVEIFRAEVTSKSEEQQKGFLDGTYEADLTKVISDPVELAGVALVIGQDISFERIK